MRFWRYTIKHCILFFRLKRYTGILSLVKSVPKLIRTLLLFHFYKFGADSNVMKKTRYIFSTNIHIKMLNFVKFGPQIKKNSF